MISYIICLEVILLTLRNCLAIIPKSMNGYRAFHYGEEKILNLLATTLDMSILNPFEKNRDK